MSPFVVSCLTLFAVKTGCSLVTPLRFGVSTSALRITLSGYPGGDEEDRTPDPLLAKQVLSQLSYTPVQQQVFPVLTRFLKIPLGTLKIKQHSALYSLVLTRYIAVSCYAP